MGNDTGNDMRSNTENKYGNVNSQSRKPEESEQTKPVYLNVTLGRGTAIMPAWVVVLFASLFVVSSLGLLVTLFVESQMMKEVRVMQIYEQDIENVLIRNGIANRSDFSYHPVSDSRNVPVK